jgi:hypothetical protein
MNDEQASELLIKFTKGLFDPDTDHLSLEIIEAVKEAYRIGYNDGYIEFSD